MTNEEAKEVFLNRGFINGFFDGDKWRQSIIVISEWLEQEPCEEMISRADMLDAIGHGTTYTTDELQKIIKGLPTVNLNTKRSSL